MKAKNIDKCGDIILWFSDILYICIIFTTVTRYKYFCHKYNDKSIIKYYICLKANIMVMVIAYQYSNTLAI